MILCYLRVHIVIEINEWFSRDFFIRKKKCKFYKWSFTKEWIKKNGRISLWSLRMKNIPKRGCSGASIKLKVILKMWFALRVYNYKKCVTSVKNINILFSIVPYPKFIKLVRSLVSNLFWPTYSLRNKKVQDILFAERNNWTQAYHCGEEKLID